MLNYAKFKELIDDTSNLKDHVDPYESDVKDFDNEDDLREYLEELVNEVEIIYYHNAMDYLKENDPSLMESLALARDCGYDLEGLNSETLATLLLQENLRGELNDLDLDEVFEEDDDTEENDDSEVE